MMQSKDRLEFITAHVQKQGFVSVKKLSELCQVTEMTIRRDLKWLEQRRRIRRTHGGAASLGSIPSSQKNLPVLHGHDEGPLADRIDVLIASAPIDNYESILSDPQGKKTIPVVAESTPLKIAETCVSVDNFEAGRLLGQWAGRYAQEHWDGRACLLDLTYHLTNTQQRSQGFINGLREVLPDSKLALSINTQSRYEMAYQLTRDALTVQKEINIIFGMNDTSALGAVHACRDLDIDPRKLIVLPFGIEGDTMRNLIVEDGYCQAGLAMFPEIVGPVCIEAAVALWHSKALPSLFTTPYALLTRDTLSDFYVRDMAGWHLQWEKVNSCLKLPTSLYLHTHHPAGELPHRIGFVYTFLEHEWYSSLIASVQSYTRHLGIELEVIDVEQTFKDEVDWRRREIARSAAAEIRGGETISLDNGATCTYLASLLSQDNKPVTVISNAVSVLEILKNSSQITLISTGGVLRRSSMNLVGPTAEATLREIRVDRLFLSVDGVSLDFGLSHDNLSEVTIKQAMIRSAREVILLADHTCFGQEAFIQVAPITAVNQIISDDALPASVRLELSKIGIRVQLASA